MNIMPDTHVLEAKVATLLDSLTTRTLRDPEGCFILHGEYDVAHMCLSQDNHNLPSDVLAQVYFREIDSMNLLREQKEDSLGFGFAVRTLTDMCAKECVGILLERAQG
jgi:ubiquinone biosynthesis protein Coq4